MLSEKGMRTLDALWLDRSSRATLQEQLARQIRERIQQGVLRPGEALPSTRDLAGALGVSRNTVVAAYDRLMSEGYLDAFARSGVHVSASIAVAGLDRRSSRGRTRTDAKPRPDDAVPAPAPPVPFRPSQPDVCLFPLMIWNRLRTRALRDEGRTLLHYQSACVGGLPSLRQNVATYLQDHRGVHCSWRNVVITAGSQQAVFLLGSLLLGPRDAVYFEDPGYVEARLACRRTGATIVPGQVDDQGLRPPAGRGDRLTLIYTTPSRQFPTGVSLSLARRLALIDYAARTRTWIVEDDYDSELRYSAPPLPSLQSLDRRRVIYLGTFSKLLFPSLRLGYVVVPDPILDEFLELKHLSDDHLPLIDQATLARFLESGAFYSHIRRCRRVYAERQARFLALAREQGLPLRFVHTDGGMNLTGFLPEGADDQAISRRLKAAGLDVPPLSTYSIKSTRPGLVFGFTAFDREATEEAFRRMGAVFEES
jgi:GntR family transcriptional regulator / MocR family aminotransferase